jgi:hypothetical protein
MAHRPKSPDHSAAARPENRFEEVKRKSREARERMNAAQQARAEQTVAAERDRDYARDDSEAAEPAASTAPRSALEKAAAQLDGEAEASEEEIS